MKKEIKDTCPKCGTWGSIVKNGYIVLKRMPTNQNRVPKYLCKTCGKSFYTVPPKTDRANAEQNLIKRFATQLYIAGLSRPLIVKLLTLKGYKNVDQAIDEMKAVFEMLDQHDFITKDKVRINDCKASIQEMYSGRNRDVLSIRECGEYVFVQLERNDKPSHLNEMIYFLDLNFGEK